MLRFVLLVSVFGVEAGLLCNVKSFGAVGDGITSDTKAVRAAIAACSGGGEVVLPSPGKFLTGPVNITSNMILTVERGAVLLGSNDLAEFPVIAPLPSYGWSRDTNCFKSSQIINGTVFGVSRYSPVVGVFNSTNVTLTGGGEINGQGPWWYDECTSFKLTQGRPRLIELNGAKGVTVNDLTLRDSPFWTVHPIYSEDIVVRNLQIFAPMNALGNTDGVNPDSSRNVVIEDLLIANSDDGVTLKSGKDQYGIAVGRPTENVFVRNITTPKGFRGGVAFGSEMSGGIRNITVQDCVFHGERGIHFKSCPGRAGFFEDVTLRRIDVAGGVGLSMSYPGQVQGGPVPLVANIALESISGAGGCSFDCAHALGGSCFGLSMVNVNVSGCSAAVPSAPTAYACVSNQPWSPARSCQPALPHSKGAYPSLHECDANCN